MLFNHPPHQINFVHRPHMLRMGNVVQLAAAPSQPQPRRLATQSVLSAALGPSQTALALCSAKKLTKTDCYSPEYYTLFFNDYISLARIKERNYIGNNLIFIFQILKMASGPYNYSYIFKYIIIGDMGVGKSCLLHQFTEKKCKVFF